MSSFRIDRQYVAFENAELRVHPGASPKQTKNAAAGTGDTDESRRIIAEQRRKAEEEARRIVEEAEKKAGHILEKSRKTAAAIIRDSQNKAGDVLNAAKLEGLRQGREEAEACANARKKKEAEELEQMSCGLKKEYADLLDGMRGDITSLIFEITKKVIGVKMKESDEIFMNLLNGAIDQLKQAGSITIRVSPADYARYFDNEAGGNLTAGADAKITVVEEEAYAPGDLVVETEGEALDMSISKQIDKIENAFISEAD